MAAWCDHKAQTVPRPKRKTKSHLRDLASDLQRIAVQTAKKGA